MDSGENVRNVSQKELKVSKYARKWAQNAKNSSIIVRDSIKYITHVALVAYIIK